MTVSGREQATAEDPAGERSAYLVLAHVVEPADERVGAWIARVGAPAVVDRLKAGNTTHPHAEGMAARWNRQAALLSDVAAIEERAASCGSRIVTRADREWPTQLAALGATQPLALWVAGAADLRLLALRSVSIVGARASTAYGEEVARSWSAELGGSGWTVVSGAAFGIDAAAHRGALAAEGTTIAVLAGGVDVPYPRAHAPLLAAITDSGLVVSESPPGEAVRRHRFLTRNRLIAALGRATVVVEAAVRSGAAATARDASALARPVLAVPGPVTSPASSGCHRMIQDGEAILAADVDDIRAALDLTSLGLTSPEGARSLDGPGETTPVDATPPVDATSPPDRDQLAGRERRVLDALPRRRAAGLDDLVVESGLGAGDVLAAAGVLVSLGWLEETAGGWRLLRT